MLVAVMHVRVVRVGVPGRSMRVRMRVFLVWIQHFIRAMFVGMMGVMVRVAVVMKDRFMQVPVLVVFA